VTTDPVDHTGQVERPRWCASRHRTAHSNRDSGIWKGGCCRADGCHPSSPEEEQTECPSKL